MVVSTQDLRQVLESSKQFTVSNILQHMRHLQIRHLRPALSTAYSVPRSQLERQIAAPLPAAATTHARKERAR